MKSRIKIIKKANKNIELKSGMEATRICSVNSPVKLALKKTSRKIENSINEPLNSTE